LTRPEEILYSHQLRTLRTAIRMRDQVSAGRHNNNGSQKPKVTEAEWAAACGTSVPNLRRWMVRGRQAREILCHANVGLVTSIAKKHYYTVKAATQAGGGVGTILTLADMIQEGNLGLMEAAERYEPERGWRFSTYAVYWIRQRISRSVADTSRVIRLPAHVHGTLSKVRKVKVEFQTMRGRDPTPEELAAALEMTTAKLAQLTASSRNVVSLENPLRAGGNTKSEADRRTIGDALASDERTPEEDALQDFMRRDVRSVLETVLEVTECAVVKLRFGLYDGKPRSVKETARLLELSGEKVRLTEARALNKLRHPQRNYRLKEYVTASSRRSTGTTTTTAATDQKVTNRTVPKKQIKVWESAWDPTEDSAHGAPVTTTTQPRSDRLWFF
jgi:RNA polymerase primary sigma factor